MDFDSATFGVDAIGVQKYLEELNTEVLTNVALKIRDTSSVEQAIRAAWVGQAPEDFLKLLREQTDIVIENLEAAKKALETEILGIKDQILDFDANVITEGK